MLPPKNNEDLTIGGKYTFDYMVKLNQEKPEEFERVKQEILEDFFQSLEVSDPERALKSRQVQFSLEGEMRKIKNPLMKATLVYRKMVEKLNELQAYLVEASKITSASIKPRVNLQNINNAKEPITNKTINVDFVQRKRSHEERSDQP